MARMSYGRLVPDTVTNPLELHPSKIILARRKVKLTQRQLAELANVPTKTIVGIECGTSRGYSETLHAVLSALENRGVDFRKIKEQPTLRGHNERYDEITPNQIRAARALLDWIQPDLADAAGVALATVKKMETGERIPYTETKQKIVGALEDKRVVFINEPKRIGVAIPIADLPPAKRAARRVRE